MYNKRIILVSFILFQMIQLFSQRVEFTYDENGNRLTRTIVVEQLQAKSVQFPVLNTAILKSSENTNTIAPDVDAKEGTMSEGSLTITNVYPNPNKGLLKINISNMPPDSKTEMTLYDLSGVELIVKRNFEGYSEIDISKFRDGIYILQIKINGNITSWKVVKNNY
jgi:hypothetical protein